MRDNREINEMKKYCTKFTERVGTSCALEAAFLPEDVSCFSFFFFF